MLVPRFFCSFFFDDDGDGGAGDAGGVADSTLSDGGEPFFFVAVERRADGRAVFCGRCTSRAVVTVAGCDGAARRFVGMLLLVIYAAFDFLPACLLPACLRVVLVFVSHD